MKKFLATCAMLGVTTVAMATTVQSANTFGVMKLNASNKTTILSVPWDNVGGGAAYVTNIVSTISGITANDVLFWYDSTLNNNKGGFIAWVATSDGNSHLYWKPSDTTYDDESYSAAEDNKTLARSGTLIISRSNTTDPIYLTGQLGTTSDTTTIACGTRESPVYSLIAPSASTNVYLNAVAWTNAADGDEISYGNTVFTYKDSKWHGKVAGSSITVDNETFTVYDDTTDVYLPAGQGAWYKSIGGSNDVTVTW